MKKSSASEYRWGLGDQGLRKADPQVIGEKLAGIKGSVGDGFTPADVVELAKMDKDLRPLFEWNDARAGKLYRIEQAGHLIRALVVVAGSAKGGEPVLVRAFASITPEGTNKPRYVTMQRALSQPDSAEQLLARALEEARNWRRIYADLAALRPIFKAIDRVAA